MLIPAVRGKSVFKASNELPPAITSAITPIIWVRRFWVTASNHQATASRVKLTIPRGLQEGRVKRAMTTIKPASRIGQEKLNRKATLLLRNTLGSEVISAAASATRNNGE